MVYEILSMSPFDSHTFSSYFRQIFQRSIFQMKTANTGFSFFFFFYLGLSIFSNFNRTTYRIVSLYCNCYLNIEELN